MQKKEGGVRLGPLAIGFFIFVVLGSAIVQILRTVEQSNEMNEN